MAALGASYVSQMKFADASKIKMMDFAGPHGGDQQWAERTQTLVPWAYHVVHRNDYVPHIPDNPDWYFHFETNIFSFSLFSGNTLIINLKSGTTTQCHSVIHSLNVMTLKVHFALIVWQKMTGHGTTTETTLKVETSADGVKKVLPMDPPQLCKKHVSPL